MVKSLKELEEIREKAREKMKIRLIKEVKNKIEINKIKNK